MRVGLLSSTVRTRVVSSVIGNRADDELVQKSSRSDFKTASTCEMNDLSVSYVDSCEIANIKFGSLINPEEREGDGLP